MSQSVTEAPRVVETVTIGRQTSGMAPFDIVVITSPDAQAARSVLGLIKSSCGVELGENSIGLGDCCEAGDLAFQTPDGTVFVSSFDPYGARLGSGGGTIAALARADEIHSKLNGDNSRPTVLICHAGGESSRYDM